MKRRLSVDSDETRPLGVGALLSKGAKSGLNISSIATVHVGLSKSFRKTNNPDRRACSLKKIFKAFVYVVIAVFRMRPRLTATEVAAIKYLYDTAGRVSSVGQLVLLMQQCGIHGSEEVCSAALADVCYHDGHLMTFEQFRHAFEHCKRDLMRQVRSSNDTLEAFTALSGGQENVEVEHMADAIEAFGLTVDVLALATPLSQQPSLPAASPSSQAGKSAVTSPLSSSAVGARQRVVSYEAFHQFFQDVSMKSRKGSADTKPQVAARSPDDEGWLELNSSDWKPSSATQLSLGEALGESRDVQRLSSNRNFSGGLDAALDAVSSNGFVASELRVSRSAAQAPQLLETLSALSLTSHAVTSSLLSSRSCAQDAQGSNACTGATSLATTCVASNSSPHLEGLAAPTVSASPVATEVALSQPHASASPSSENGAGRQQSVSPSRRKSTAARSKQPARRSTDESWAVFIERTQADASRRRLRITSTQRRSREFVVPCVAQSSCLNPPPEPSHWRELKLERSVLAALNAEPLRDDAQVAACNGATYENNRRAPFTLRPLSAMSAPAAGSAGKVARSLARPPSGFGRPKSAATPLSLANVSLRADLDAFRASEGQDAAAADARMNRWLSGGRPASAKSALH